MADEARRRDLFAIAAECERLGEAADDADDRLAYQRAAEAAAGLASAPPIGAGGASLVASLLPSDVARAEEQSTVRDLIDAASRGEPPGRQPVLIGAAVITGIAAVGVGSTLGWTFGRVVFALGAAIAAVVFGVRRVS